jgi:hypothetical protein
VLSNAKSPRALANQISSVKASLPAVRSVLVAEVKHASDEVGIDEMNDTNHTQKKYLREGGLLGSIGQEMIMQRGDRTVQVLTVEPVSLLLAAGN